MRVAALAREEEVLQAAHEPRLAPALQAGVAELLCGRLGQCVWLGQCARLRHRDCGAPAALARQKTLQHGGRRRTWM